MNFAFPKLIVGIGILLVIIGLLLLGAEKIGLHLGKLPGDLIYRKGNTTIYFPIVTMLLLSIVLSLLFWLIRK